MVGFDFHQDKARPLPVWDCWVAVSHPTSLRWTLGGFVDVGLREKTESLLYSLHTLALLLSV